MASAVRGGVTSVAGEDLGTFSVPFDPEGSRGPDIELGLGRPTMRNQRGVSQTLKGGKGSQGGQGGKGNKGDKGHSGPPPQTQSSSKGKQPSRNLRAERAGGPPLPGVRAAPARSQPQPPSSLSSGLSSSHHFERPVGNLEAPGRTLRSATAAAAAAATTTLGSVAFCQALHTGAGPRSRVPGSSPAERDPTTPAGREQRPQARPHDEDDDSDGDDHNDPRGSGTTKGLVLRSRVVPRLSSAAAVVGLEACPETQRASPRLTARVPVAHSDSTRSSSQRGSSRATPSRGRSMRSSSQIRSSLIRASRSSCNRPAFPRKAF
jgi:hypothetical protein|uniref:Predicted gene, 21025 n=1 Tax=Mus musculus TaxID=10090 RepID=A0ABA7IXD5_MOUSE